MKPRAKTSNTSGGAVARGASPFYRWLYFLATLCVAVLATSALATSALAAVPHEPIASFGSDGTSSTSFAENSQLAFERDSRRLYVVDKGSPGIYGFDASAPPTFPGVSGFAPLATDPTGPGPGLAVDDTALASAGNVYFIAEGSPSSAGRIFGFSSSGVPLGGNFPIDPSASPGEPVLEAKDICGGAVDSSGNLWVANWDRNSENDTKVLKYSSSGAFLEAIDTSAQSGPNNGPCQLAFDSNDDLYIAMYHAATWRYTAASGYASAEEIDSGDSRAIAVDTSIHRVYVAHPDKVNEYESDGSPAPSGEFATGIAGADFNGIAIDPSNHYAYVSDAGNGKVAVFGPGVLLPSLVAGAASALTNTSASLSGTVNPLSLALTDCRFEYVTEAAFAAGGFSDLSSGGSVPCVPGPDSIPADQDEHPLTAAITDLAPSASYRFRLSATNVNGTGASSPATFATPGPPVVETTGSPVRTATTAQLNGRIYPHGEATTFHFEYGQSPCDSSSCASTADQSAGSGSTVRLVSSAVAGLASNTIYHYRVVADNGNVSGPAFGNDMTVVTRPSDAPLEHGHFPGPPGSDRAYEQVNQAETGGNPVGFAGPFSVDGDRAVYSIFGGTPIAQTGNASSFYFAQRSSDPAGWGTENITPPRNELVGTVWNTYGHTNSLSSLIALNENAQDKRGTLWRLSPGAAPQEVYDIVPPEHVAANGAQILTVADSPRILAGLEGGEPDSAFPAAAAKENLYDISSGSPRLVGFLADGTVPPCGLAPAGAHAMSADGSLAFFSSPELESGSCQQGSRSQLYVRDLNAEETSLISSPPISGVDCGLDRFVGVTSQAAYFVTRSRLAAADTAPLACSEAVGGDVYRYDFGDAGLTCVTCAGTGGIAAAVAGSVAIADDGSRVYFRSASTTPLLPGAPTAASPSGGPVYVLEVQDGELRLLGGPGVELGSGALQRADGSVAIFNAGSPSLNSIGGFDNGGTVQQYRYDDRDRSLTCTSCPGDGSVPAGPVSGVPQGSGDGEVTAFSTPSALLPADQNTPGSGVEPSRGTDAYEWRDGRVFLLSDGLTSWPKLTEPSVEGVSASGRDIFFLAPAQYTPDALDGYLRLYDARVGGGIEFADPPRPCALEVCQGTPKGAPQEQAPGTMSFAGPGNTSQPRAKCRKGKVRRKGRCVAKHKKQNHQRANENRGTSR